MLHIHSMRFNRLTALFRTALLIAVASTLCVSNAISAEVETGKKIKALFLGDAKSHHNPIKLFNVLEEPLKKVGIDITFTEKNADLTADNLAKYDCLILYSNSLAIEESQEKALLDFVEGGKGFVPIHCASACFVNSPKFIALVGGKFKSHHTGVFDTQIVAADHPVMKGFAPFQVWDETYVHDHLNEVGRTLLQTRTEGTREEPWTWVRSRAKAASSILLTDTMNAAGQSRVSWN